MEKRRVGLSAPQVWFACAAMVALGASACSSNSSAPDAAPKKDGGLAGAGGTATGGPGGNSAATGGAAGATMPTGGAAGATMPTG
ncbi:MAG: hypothetical protein WBV96_25445, partial [Polyangia bacterium]